MIVHKGQQWLTITEFAKTHKREAAYAKHVSKAMRERMSKTDTLHLKTGPGEPGYPNQYWYRKGAAWPLGEVGRPRPVGAR